MNEAAGTVRVVFTPSGLEGRVPEGTTVLEAARGLGVDLDTVCGGRGICGRCQVRPGVGAFPKWGLDVGVDALAAPGSLETDYRGNRPLGDGQRLGCAAAICGNVVLDVPPESQIHRQVVRKDVALDALVLDPPIELRFVEVDRASLDDDRAADERLADALADQWGIDEVGVETSVVPTLHAALEPPAGDNRETVAVTVALRRDGTGGETDTGTPSVAAAWAGFVGTAYGVAIDVGSTTIAGHLLDLTTGAVVATAGRMNPQIRFGEDLMSRVSYVMMNPGGDAELTNAVRGALDELVTELLDDAEIERDRLLELVLVGNPVMHHLLLGIDPTPLGAAPFQLATRQAIAVPATDLDLGLPLAQAWIGPCIAGHVGADTTAAIVAEGPHRSDAVQLLVDVGTNAEIVLGNRHGLLAASSPTGPAFEGAQLSCGVRAAAGAIERVRIDDATLEPRFRVIGVEQWSDEDGFDDALAALGTGVIGVCGSGIIEVLSEMSRVGIVDRAGVIKGSLAERSPRIEAAGRTFAYRLTAAGGAGAGDEPGAHPGLRVEQNDVRAIQLAKAALKAGIDLLLERAGIEQVDEVRLAGAFGAHIDPEHAVAIDLLPPAASMSSPGNSAGSGAVRLLLSLAARAEIQALVPHIVKVETATEPRFQDLFVEAMGFPLAPVGSEGTTSGRRRRSRRRAAGTS
ncbi:MAG: ASKHA domain-containing protein [Acidimicrobiales bacterium]